MRSDVYLGGRVRLFRGDCRDALKSLPANSLDSCVCDPPYALVSIVKRFGDGAPSHTQTARDIENRSTPAARLARGFMGKAWDNGETAFAVEFWAEVLRVLKPGGHVVAFSGTRTYHHLASAIDSAGFEIREMLTWQYATGFPKSHNIKKELFKKGLICACGEDHGEFRAEDVSNMRGGLDADQPVSGGSKSDMLIAGVQSRRHRPGEQGEAVAIQSKGDDQVRGMRGGKGGAKGLVAQGEAPDMLAALQRNSQGQTSRSQPLRLDREEKASWLDVTGEEPGMEGRGNAETAARELQRGALRQSSEMGDPDGEGGRLHNGASPSDGEDVRVPPDQNGSGSPSGSRPIEQQRGEFGALADELLAQDGGAWPNCGGCGKPMFPEYDIGTALKPALEPVCVARKPISEPTVALNMLKWGVGALNIGACRIPAEKATGWGGAAGGGGTWNESNSGLGKDGEARPVEGRYPANILHDGSTEVVSLFPNTQQPGGSVPKRTAKSDAIYGEYSGAGTFDAYGDTGSASRFFFSAKADADDRMSSGHPTVKPRDLMRWLVRLVTPKGGTVLDPFAGTGPTGEAAFWEGCNAILCEREPEYCEDIARRMRHVLSGPEERKRARTTPAPAAELPLFSA